MSCLEQILFVNDKLLKKTHQMLKLFFKCYKHAIRKLIMTLYNGFITQDTKWSRKQFCGTLDTCKIKCYMVFSLSFKNCRHDCSVMEKYNHNSNSRTLIFNIRMSWYFWCICFHCLKQDIYPKRPMHALILLLYAIGKNDLESM